VVNYQQSIFTVERGPIVAEKTLMAEIVPSKQDDLYFRASGYVNRVTVKQGNVVKKGDVLAEMQIDDLLNQLQQARIDLEVAQANLAKDKAQKQFDLEKAQADVVIAQKRVDLAKISVQQSLGLDRERAQLNLDIEQQNLAVAQENVQMLSEDTTSFDEQAVKRSELAVERLEGLVAERQIVAPYDCVVLKSGLRPGQQVDAFFQAFSVGDPSVLIVRAAYDFDLSSILNVNSEVSLSLSSDAKESYPVKYMPNFLPLSANKDATNSSNTDYMYFSIPTGIPQDQLPVGRSVVLDVILGRKNNALLLPPAAIREYKGLKFVIVLDGDKKRRVEISDVGLKTTDKVEVIADLKEGDQVLGP
jgi:multidrug efflux pump subunit AcrA (membrane-fusion protein)